MDQRHISSVATAYNWYKEEMSAILFTFWDHWCCDVALMIVSEQEHLTILSWSHMINEMVWKFKKHVSIQPSTGVRFSMCTSWCTVNIWLLSEHQHWRDWIAQGTNASSDGDSSLSCCDTANLCTHYDRNNFRGTVNFRQPTLISWGPNSYFSTVLLYVKKGSNTIKSSSPGQTVALGFLRETVP